MKLPLLDLCILLSSFTRHDKTKLEARNLVCRRQKATSTNIDILEKGARQWRYYATASPLSPDKNAALN